MTFNSYINHRNRRYITEILPIWRKTQLNNHKRYPRCQNIGIVSSTKNVDVPYPKIVYTVFAFEISKFLSRTISCFEEIQIQIKIQENL